MPDLESFRRRYPDIYVSECSIQMQRVYGRENDTPFLNHNSLMYILYGGFNRPNPQQYLDSAVRDFVGHDMYNEFIESTLDNPWSRIIIFDVNNLIA